MLNINISKNELGYLRLLMDLAKCEDESLVFCDKDKNFPTKSIYRELGTGYSIYTVPNAIKSNV